MAFRKFFQVFLVVAMSIPTVSQVASASLHQESVPAPPRTHHVYIIGDSLTVGTEMFASLRRRVDQTKRWKSAIVDAKVGRSIPQGINIVKRTKFRSPTAIVVALGTNDVLSRRVASYPARVIDEFMRATKGKPVLWVNLEISDTRPDWRARGMRFNRELRKARSRWPNLEIADWEKSFTPKGESRFSRDGIHLSVTGYRTRTTFMLSQLNKWKQRLWDQSTTTIPTPTPAPTVPPPPFLAPEPTPAPTIPDP
jgi:lysophospholipase L1-like esterase